MTGALGVFFYNSHFFQRTAETSSTEERATVTACFTPSQPCANSIVEKIDEAETQIRVQAYGFSSDAIATALANAHNRGVDVAVILDKSNERPHQPTSDAELVARAGIPLFVDYRPAIAHNKVIVIDGHLVITGSYNFTKSAETRNAENVTFIDSTKVAQSFLSNWNSRREASRVYTDPLGTEPIGDEHR